MEMFNINMFLLLVDAVPVEQFEYHDGAYRCNRLHGIKRKLADHFWRRAQNTLEIQNSGVLSGDSGEYDIYYFDNSL